MIVRLNNGIILSLFRSPDNINSGAFRNCYDRIGCKVMAFVFDAFKKLRRIVTDNSSRGLSKGRGIEKSFQSQSEIGVLTLSPHKSIIIKYKQISFRSN